MPPVDRPDGSDLVRAVHLGHAPNCSATGSIVGDMLLSAAATAVLINSVAVWLAARAKAPSTDDAPPRLRRDRRGGVLLLPSSVPLGPARVELTERGVQLALAGGATLVGRVDAPRRPPDEVHLSVTERCPVGCSHCYISATPTGRDADLDQALASLAELDAAGVHEIALGGGEASLSNATLALAQEARQRGMIPNPTTSGAGLSPDLALQLAEVVGQVNISIDPGLRRAPTSDLGWRAIALLQRAGVRVGVNTVLSAATWAQLDALAADLAAREIGEWQWLRLKPSGRGRSTYLDDRLSPEQRLQIWPRLLELERAHGLRIRIDCAMVPFLAVHQVPVEALEQAGVYGCPGGDRLASRTAEGRWLPCSFAGDLSEQEPTSFPEAWATDPTLTTWRTRAEKPPSPCGACAYRAVCRGGCRIVAAHLTGDPLAPDPECPLVSG